VVVKDANSCEAYGTFTIAQPEQLVITPVVENVKCFGGNDGSISLTVTGGTGDYQYSWTGPNGFNETTKDITSLTYGIYEVKVTDANSCEAYGTFTLTQPEQLVITPAVENVKCFGGNDGSISLSVTGGTGRSEEHTSELQSRE